MKKHNGNDFEWIVSRDREQDSPSLYPNNNHEQDKIFYVEDELFLGKIVKESLESRGFEVIMESDGAKATALFKKSKPDICVLDIMLPNKDGFTIADEIQ